MGLETKGLPGNGLPNPCCLSCDDSGYEAKSSVTCSGPGWFFGPLPCNCEYRLIMIQYQIVSRVPFTKRYECVCKFPLLSSYILLRRLKLVLRLYRILRFDGRENSEHKSFEGTALVSSDLHGACVKIW